MATLEEIILTAEVEEQPWLARFARGLQAAVLLVANPEPWRADSCASLVEECERSGDEWGAVVLALALGVAHCFVVTRRPPVVRPSSRGARSLNAPVIPAWAEIIGAFGARPQATGRRYAL